MRVGCPKEIKNHEYRGGLTPESAKELIVFCPLNDVFFHVTKRNEFHHGGVSPHSVAESAWIIH